jgi:prolyl-tRNA synthetase
MKQSQLLTKTLKEVPSDEPSRNAQLLQQAGYVAKEMAGVYVYLPLGLRVLNKIMNIIREEMDAIGGQEILMTSLQNPELWKATDRWSDESIDVWFRTKLQNGTELGLGNTHEEPITNLMKQYVQSYRDLPFSAYQLQTKFRNELRAKSGIMRSREFIMKDLYSFSKDEEEHNVFYEKSKEAYMNVFKRCGIGETTYITFASGGAFSEFSHEFQTLTDAGEDTVYLNEEKGIAVNEEVYTDEVLNNLGLEKEGLVKHKAIEVGNIFTLSTKFSEPLGLTYADEAGENKPVFMGSYGIGPGRLMGTIAEVLSDDKGIVWPKSVAPYAVHLIGLGSKDDAVQGRIDTAVEELYNGLKEVGIDVLWDDRDLRPGAKFADADLLGMPLRLVVSEKTLAEDSVEWKERTSSDMRLVKIAEIVESAKSWINE